MQVRQIKISNFRGIKSATINFAKHSVIIGDNNTGKTTVLEALDLTLGPDRLSRVPAIDEHDFFKGMYLEPIQPKYMDTEVGSDEYVIDQENLELTDEELESKLIKIVIEVMVIDLNDEQKTRFGDYLEFWDTENNKLIESSDEDIERVCVQEALRVSFIVNYDAEEDDFECKTYYTRTLENDTNVIFSKKDKQFCGFLYLRSIRTGSRALSLERGSLLDIILRLKEVRPRMWEDAIAQLADYTIASDPKLGVSGILESINTALQKYVPKEWGCEPHLKVSNLTRQHLRKIITAFVATGTGDHSAPFNKQGTGTINMLILSMLSLIAEDKQNVIFAMEEPETAIPPYAQKRIVHEVKNLAAQAIFTSHSPYVLEEFSIKETIVLTRNDEGQLSQFDINLPSGIKPKRYRQEFRTRFCEGLLARRVLVAEGATEADAFPAVCRRLAEIDCLKYSSLEALGICTIDAGGDTSIPALAELFQKLGKTVYSICDKQEEANQTLVENSSDLMLMHDEKGFENLIIKHASDDALKRFASEINWPDKYTKLYADPVSSYKDSLKDYFCDKKADLGIADFLTQCSEDEIPKWIKESSIKLKSVIELVSDNEGLGTELCPVSDDEVNG